MLGSGLLEFGTIDVVEPFCVSFWGFEDGVLVCVGAVFSAIKGGFGCFAM